MTKTILLPLALLHVCAMQAQPSIEHSSVAPFGVVTSMHTIPDPGTLPAIGDGMDQVWNFNNTVFQALGTMDFRTSAGTPYAGAFPLANWALAQHFTGQGTLYQYLRITSTALQMHGRNIPYNPVIYQQPTTVLKFPMAFGDSFLDQYVNEDGPNSRTWSYSGHGTILSPLGTFDNVAKVGNSLGDIILWNLSPLYPIFYYEAGSMYFTKLISVNTDVGIGEPGGAAFRAWPNPCGDALHLSALAARTTWQVVDPQGRTVATGMATRPGEQQLDLGGVAAGSYVLVLDDAGQRSHVRFVKDR